MINIPRGIQKIGSAGSLNLKEFSDRAELILEMVCVITQLAPYPPLSA
jgi:hypothetical protein